MLFAADYEVTKEHIGDYSKYVCHVDSCTHFICTDLAGSIFAHIIADRESRLLIVLCGGKCELVYIYLSVTVQECNK